MRSSILTVIALSLWAASLATGFALWMDYDSKPGEAAIPRKVTIAEDASRYRILFFAHPLCPCTRASRRELERVLAEFDQVQATVVFCKPSDAVGPDWNPDNFVSSATAGLQVQWDDGGVEAKRFGVTTSGHVLLFHPDGSLLFSGGITRARGYEGESSSSEALRARLMGKTRELYSAPVFGCPLLDS
jgi:hypothetical protein